MEDATNVLVTVALRLLLLTPHRVLCCLPTPGKGCKAAGRHNLPLGPTASDLGLRALGHNLANFATQDRAGGRGVITHPDRLGQGNTVVMAGED